MLQKIFIALCLSVVIWLWVFSGYSFVLWSTPVSSQIALWDTTSSQVQASFLSDLWRTVYLDDERLRSLIVVFSSESNLANYDIHSSCNTTSQHKFSYRNLHFFYLTYLEDTCDNPTIALKNNNAIISRSLGSLNFSTKSQELSVLLDYSDARLSSLDAELARRLRPVGIFRNYRQDLVLETLPDHFKKYQALELQYKRSLIFYIQNGRTQKYISPVPWFHITRQANKIPNAGRPYRAGYTDGIHHGWDIDAPLGTPVVALDDGIIIRITDGFTSEDFKRIVYGNTLSYETQLENLDILRGNQVWHKTLKWELIFYSHLQDVSDELEDGMFIEQWTYIGTVGITWVPVDDYDDYHLHFDVKIPPFTVWKEWTYTLMDYMKWPWSGKWQSQEQVFWLIDSMFER